MKTKRVIVAIIILILGIGVFFIAKNYKTKKEFWDARSKLPFADTKKGEEGIVNPEDVVAIKIKNPGGEITIEKKQDGKWYLTSPIYYPANKNVELFPIRLLGIEIEQEVERGSVNLAPYMLDNPDVVVQFKLKNEDNWHEIRFGRRSPTESLYYTYIPEKSLIFLSHFSYKFDFNGTYHSYIDNRLFLHSPRTGNKAVFRTPTSIYEFSFNEKTKYWYMEKPIPGKAHAQTFPSFLDLIEAAEMLGLVIENLSPSETGLDNPQFEITFSKPGEWSETLLIGNLKDENIYYAKKADLPQIFLIGQRVIDSIFPHLGKMQIVKALWFPKVGVRRIEFKTKDGSFAFSRNAKGETWKMEGVPDALVDSPALDNFLLKLHSAKNKGYTGGEMPKDAAQYGLDDPWITINMEFFAPQFAPVTLFYGKKDSRGKYIYFSNTEDTGIMMIDADFGKIMPSSAEHFLQKKK